jgi:hypothetical protein
VLLTTLATREGFAPRAPRARAVNEPSLRPASSANILAEQTTVCTSCSHSYLYPKASQKKESAEIQVSSSVQEGRSLRAAIIQARFRLQEAIGRRRPTAVIGGQLRIELNLVRQKAAGELCPLRHARGIVGDTDKGFVAFCSALDMLSADIRKIVGKNSLQDPTGPKLER